MDLWKSQSNPGKQLALSIGCTFVGLILVYGFRSFGAGTNSMAGFLLGLLLFFIGAAGILVSGKQIVTVDPHTKYITIEDKNRFGTKTRAIPFRDVVEVHIGYTGKKSNFVNSYHLVLRLRNGQEYPLFAPGRFFEGASNRAIVAGWKQRLEEYLNY
jgi:hypothetical protein